MQDNHTTIEQAEAIALANHEAVMAEARKHIAEAFRLVMDQHRKGYSTNNPKYRNHLKLQLGALTGAMGANK
jgi:hypothetical protein